MSAAEVVQTMTLQRFPQKRRFPPKPKVRLSLHKALSLADWVSQITRISLIVTIPFNKKCLDM